MWRDITVNEREAFNALASHPLQSFEWGEFREKTGIKVIRRGLFDGKKLLDAFQITLHPIPHTPWNIGYFPKGKLPSEKILQELYRICKEQKCIFIQLEPNEEAAKGAEHMANGKNSIVQSAHPLFTKYTFILDLTKSEEELLKAMHPKTRYNIKIAQKHGVVVREEASEEAFQTYWKLTYETTKRQGFFAHTKEYHAKMWDSLKSQIPNPKSHTNSKITNSNNLSARLFMARFQNTPLVAWILFTFHDTLYYPYGASSNLNREVMASNLMMWEAIKFGKKLGLKKFDMWGALGENPDTKDSWYGFHKFKMGYGPKLTEFVGSYDLIINSFLYQGYRFANWIRWFVLKFK